jgi:glycine/D-amino acid oxidase-like deaminating enzyme
LWTAYYLAKADPHLRVAVLERDIAGFGASGRNGGWVSPAFATPMPTLAASHGRDAALAMQRVMYDTVDEVGRVAAAEGIDARYHKGGCLWLSTSPGQTPRLRRVFEEQREYTLAADDWVWLSRSEALDRLHVEGCLGGMYSPLYASVQPARLARGLADAVERLGVRIYEQTQVTAVSPRCAETAVGLVRAENVILATEAYTVQLPGRERQLVPIYDFMVATAPLPAAVLTEIGWAGREVLIDGRYLLIYAQRTADDRIAIGGTTAPYHFGSRISEKFERPQAVFARIEIALRRLFPALADVPITHRWGGVLGATRDWHTCVDYDPATGLGWAGGYVGDGVATSNLAGRTLTDLVLRRDGELSRLPWVGHRPRQWDREPLRWLAANGVGLVMGHADDAEFGKGRPVRWKPLLDKIEEVVGW